jgi:hypothetical protein
LRHAITLHGPPRPAQTRARRPKDRNGGEPPAGAPAGTLPSRGAPS